MIVKNNNREMNYVKYFSNEQQIWKEFRTKNKIPIVSVKIYDRIRLLDNLDNCQVLCPECHSIKTKIVKKNIDLNHHKS
tara:strand:+ start:1305 stop:1541 length:237 start_codon:yes stop_codon:yes gene_type:complete